MTQERPILFSGPMVNAILAGTKTQTRRVVKPQPVELDEPWPNSDSHNCWHDIQSAPEYHGECGNIPFAHGLRLWVKETACFQLSDKKKEKVICYRAGGDEILDSQQWTPSIFMPRWASRITLRKHQHCAQQYLLGVFASWSVSGLRLSFGQKYSSNAVRISPTHPHI